MNKNEILEIVKGFESSSLTKFEFENSEIKLALEKNTVRAGNRDDEKESFEKIKKPETVSVHCEEEKEEMSVDSTEYVEVKAPLVGVFYAASAPDADPYVKVGDQVEEGQTLCLVEAMKMMNELKSPTRGIVKAVKGKNGELVQFDQVLFEVEPC